MSIKNAQPGEVLYFVGDDLTMLVVMVSDEGIRYIEPMNPEFDDHGNIITSYASYETLSEWTISLGSITNISASLIGKRPQ